MCDKDKVMWYFRLQPRPESGIDIHGHTNPTEFYIRQYDALFSEEPQPDQMFVRMEIPAPTTPQLDFDSMDKVLSDLDWASAWKTPQPKPKREKARVLLEGNWANVIVGTRGVVAAQWMLAKDWRTRLEEWAERRGYQLVWPKGPEGKQPC